MAVDEVDGSVSVVDGRISTDDAGSSVVEASSVDRAVVSTDLNMTLVFV